MRRIISISEVVEEVDLDGGRFEACATAEADYDETKSQLMVRLDSFLRPADLKTGIKQFSPDWLPRKETVKESVAPEEASEVAKEIFHRWVKKVHQSNPLAADR